MLQPKIQPSDGLSFRTCSVFIFMVLQSVGGFLAEQSQLICSHQPIAALAGGNVILLCHLEPPIDVSSETVMFIRADLVPKYIHVHQDGRPHFENQNPSFKNRTALFVDELKNGNVSLIISNVTRSDAGEYKCFLLLMMKNMSVQLIVGVVSTPVIEFVSNKSREVVLQCEAKGWYPEPEVFWLDGEGNPLSAGPTETVRGPDDLYTVRRNLTVEKSDNFTCRVQQKNINQTRETHFYVPDHFFTVQSSLSQTQIIIIIIIIIILLFLLVIFLTVKYFSNNGVHRVKQAMSKMQEKLKVKKNDANETAHELCAMLDGKKQQEEREELDRTERLQTEEASAARDNTEEETKDNSKCSETVLNMD